MPTTRPFRTLLLAVFAFASLGASCGQRAVTLMPGVVNDAGNRSLRRAIFSFATSEICNEMKGKSVPLRMSDADPSIGRFFPTGCVVTELGNENLFVQFLGHGYAWTNLTGRVGFEAAASIEYSHDFFVDGSSMYVYFSEVRTQSSSFKALMLERADGGVAGPALALLGHDVPSVIEPLGRRVMEGELARGFTVVREGDGTIAFALGVVEKGKRPPAPFDASRARSRVLANDRTELHVGQRDYVGPFEVIEGTRALVMTAALEGAPAIDVQIVPRASAEIWEAQYERYARTGPAPFPVVADDVLATQAFGDPTVPGVSTASANWRREFPLAPGAYYVVLDHTGTAGRTSPASAPGDDRAALVNYAIELVR